MIFKSLVAISFFTAVSVFALEGGMATAGGKGIVCFQNKNITEIVRSNSGKIYDEYLSQITSITTLDFQYAQLSSGLFNKPNKIVPLNDGETFSEYLDRILARIKTTVPHLFDQIRNSKNKFSDDYIVLRESPLLPIFDDFDVATFDSELCTLTTIATQYREEGKDYLHIDSRLFNHPAHEERSKSTLLLHEYLYLIARNEGKQNSRSTRKLLKLLISNNSNTKLDKIVKMAYLSGFLKNRPVHTSNGYTSNGLDYTFHAEPINTIYYVATAYLHGLGHIVRTFDENRPSYVESSRDLMEQSRKLFQALGIKLKTRGKDSLLTVRKSLQIIKENQEVIDQSLFADLGKKLKKNLQIYVEERRSALTSEMNRLKPYFKEHYINRLSGFLSETQMTAIESISIDVGENYFRLIENPIIPNGWSKVGYDRVDYSISSEKIFYSVEDLAERIFPILLHDLNSSSPRMKDLTWVTTEIYKSYHKNGTLNYLDFIFPIL